MAFQHHATGKHVKRGDLWYLKQYGTRKVSEVQIFGNFDISNTRATEKVP